MGKIMLPNCCLFSHSFPSRFQFFVDMISSSSSSAAAVNTNKEKSSKGKAPRFEFQVKFQPRVCRRPQKALSFAFLTLVVYVSYVFVSSGKFLKCFFESLYFFVVSVKRSSFKRAAHASHSNISCCRGERKSDEPATPLWRVCVCFLHSST